MSWYGASKVAAEIYCRTLERRDQMRIAILRFTVLYGTGDTIQRAIPNFVGSAIRHEPIRVFGGEELRDYLHVDDAARAVDGRLAAAALGNLQRRIRGRASRCATLPTPCSASPAGARRSSSILARNPRLISCSTSRGSARRPDSHRLAFFQTGWRSRLPAQRPPTLVFDLDGTLLDVSARHHHVYSTVCASLGGEPLARADYWHLKRQRTAWSEILAQSGLPGADVTEFEAKFVELIELPDSLGFDVLFPDTVPVLTRLAATYRCTLVSLRSSPTALRAQLAVFALTPFFDTIENSARRRRSGVPEGPADP